MITIVLVVLVLSCNTTEPPPVEKMISLSLEDVSSIEAWIKLTATNLKQPATVTLKQNNTVTQDIVLSYADTVIYIDSLLPNTTYNFQASSIQSPVSSNQLQVTTMDTTSHNFTWQTWTFGEHSSSVLYDVAIIDENNIWAVGEIYKNDSLGNPDPHAYNAVHWDGSQWKLRRIKTNACGGVVYPPIKAIFTFSSNDILFAHIDGSISYYNGIEFINDCSLITQLNGSANKIWGMSKDDFYVVSGNGFIAHYTNGQWTKIESGTTTIINDVWGVQYDNINNFILSAVSNVASPGDRKILKLNNNVVSNFLWDTGRRVQSIWFKKSNAIYASGGGVFSLKDGNHWEEIKEIPLYYSEKIRGSANNDILVAGDFGLLAHYNGVNWKIFNNPTADIYYSCAVNENMVVVVGLKGNKGIIALANK